VRDIDMKAIEGNIGTPDTDETAEHIGFCLDRIYEDKQHYIYQEVVRGLTFEELTGALLAARESAKSLLSQLDDLSERNDFLIDQATPDQLDKYMSREDNR
jgi:hypothetical protein